MASLRRGIPWAAAPILALQGIRLTLGNLLLLEDAELSLTPGDWIAVTPPRVPELRTVQEYIAWVRANPARSHYATTAAWGLTPLEDQQLAGLIMWIPAGLAYLVALIPVVLPALRTPPDWTEPTVAGVSARGTP